MKLALAGSISTSLDWSLGAKHSPSTTSFWCTACSIVTERLGDRPTVELVRPAMVDNQGKRGCKNQMASLHVSRRGR